MRHSIWLALQGLLALTFQLTAEAADTSLALLPTTTPVQAKVMQIGMPPAAVLTMQKLQAALASQPEWARTFIAEATPGQPLPYHPNLRITEDEYKSLLAAAERPALVQIGTLSLSTERLHNGGIRIVTQPATSKVNGLTITADEGSVLTPIIRLTEKTTIRNQDENGATGRWTGMQWRYQSISSEQALSVKFALGKRLDHGDGIIYYEIKNTHAGKADEHYEVLLFPVP
jgi:hypothetical protein